MNIKLRLTIWGEIPYYGKLTRHFSDCDEVFGERGLSDPQRPVRFESFDDVVYFTLAHWREWFPDAKELVIIESTLNNYGCWVDDVLQSIPLVSPPVKRKQYVI